MIGMHDHRNDGYHQRNGIDRSIILSNSKQLLIDEKTRFRNKKTGEAYTDIALESLSDMERGIPGWAVKDIMADYIAYLIAPIGKCYLIPVLQMQLAWKKYGAEWAENARPIKAVNKDRNSGRTWITLSTPVKPRVLYRAMLEFLQVDCEVWDPDCNPFEGGYDEIVE